MHHIGGESSSLGTLRMKNMAFEMVGDLFILVHNKEVPTDAEWALYTSALRSRTEDMDEIGTLIYTEGGGPTAAQRKALNDVLGGRTTRAAVVSDASMVKMITTALGWFNPKIKAFSPNESTEAFDYLGIPRSQINLIWSEIRRLRCDLDTSQDEANAP
jgi:hypothetical protein